MDTFRARSLCVIDDFTKEERLYLFSQVKKLKEAIKNNDTKLLDSFRINDPDYGIYEVFLEDSTRTKESFRNAISFHHAKLTEMSADNSSFNKGESYADTFNTLCGYSNRIFIIRSKVEGVCAYLDKECSEYSKRNNLGFKPAFINAGDGKHEHPTQELLDEYTFLEDNLWDTSYLHIALVGDLYHGRTVHSKADGLKLWSKVKVDLIAPEELQMPSSYLRRMKDNGFEVRVFSSIEKYLKENDDIATKWYFTRPQLERMGEKILQKQDELRKTITFREEFIPLLKENTKFYHPLPRHKVHPTIPTFLDNTPLNGWERQSINGMYTRIVLLALIAGKIGSDYVSSEREETEAIEDNWIEEVKNPSVKKREISEGVKPIRDGIVIDHILRGENPEEIRRHMILIRKVMALDGLKGGEWVSQGQNGKFKGIIFRPGYFSLDHKAIKRLAAVAPGCTLNIIENGKVKTKIRTKMPPRIYNFDDLMCTNEACISNDSQSENVKAMFIRTKDNNFRCAYCSRVHSFKEIFKSLEK